MGKSCEGQSGRRKEMPAREKKRQERNGLAALDIRRRAYSYSTECLRQIYAAHTLLAQNLAT